MQKIYIELSSATKLQVTPDGEHRSSLESSLDEYFRKPETCSSNDQQQILVVLTSHIREPWPQIQHKPDDIPYLY